MTFVEFNELSFFKVQQKSREATVSGVRKNRGGKNCLKFSINKFSKSNRFVTEEREEEKMLLLFVVVLFLDTHTQLSQQLVLTERKLANASV